MKQIVSTLGLMAIALTIQSVFAQSGVASFTANATTNTTSATGTNPTGYQEGQSFTFSGVAAGINAKVTIVSFEAGASLDQMDDNNLTMPAAFAPRIKVNPNSFGAVNFRIEFVDAVTGNPKSFRGLSTTMMDVDGTANQIYEEDAVDMGGNSSFQFHHANPEIALTTQGNQRKVKNFGGVEYDGVDTAATKVKFTVKSNSNRYWFLYRIAVDNRTNSALVRQKGLYVIYDLSTVPVKYTNLNAHTYTNGVQLNWITEFERDNSHFEVERSFDRSSFSTVGMVLDAESAVNNNKTYRFKDNAAILKSKSIVYYRLKQVDHNGSISYSSVVAVKLKMNGENNLQLFPNPVKNQTTVTFKSSVNTLTTIHVVSLSGQIVKNISWVPAEGVNNYTLDNLQNLPAGQYIILVKQGGELIGSQKLNKL